MKTIGILGGMGRFNPQRASYTSSTRFVSKSHNCCVRCFNPKRASYTSSTQEPSLGTMLSKSFNPKRASYTSSTSAMEKSFEAQRAVSIPNGLPTLLPPYIFEPLINFSIAVSIPNGLPTLLPLRASHLS